MHRSALCFFFSSRRRHTRSLCDWSSDVCSSDLRLVVQSDRLRRRRSSRRGGDRRGGRGGRLPGPGGGRKRVGEGKRVDLGGRRIIKKKKTCCHQKKRGAESGN